MDVDSMHPAGTTAPRWTARESEFLAITLRLLQQHGYERLTVAAVAGEARASKATVYRRWPTKAELVLAAFIQGAPSPEAAPDTGSLRTDLLAIAEVVCVQAGQHASTMTAVLIELARMPALAAALEHEFVRRPKAMVTEVLTRAVGRGEIDASAVNDDLWDVLPGYLIFRHLMPGRQPTRVTTRAFVDEVLMPSLTRKRH